MIHQQNTFDKWNLRDKSVQAICTSPPYWRARHYHIPDIEIQGYDGTKLITPCKEHTWETYSIKRAPMNINRKAGKLTKYEAPKVKYCVDCGAFKGQYGQEKTAEQFINHTLLWCREAYRVLKDDGCFFLNIGDSWENKCKQLIPHRIAIGLIKNGWILRNDIIWVKSLALPEQHQDRFSKMWEPVFFFVKSQKYYFSIDGVQTPFKQESLERFNRSFTSKKNDGLGMFTNEAHGKFKKKIDRGEVKGANPKDVWVFSISSSGDSHYAIYPDDLPKTAILCSTKIGDTVLDPFCGSGQTPRVAKMLGRRGVGFDLGYHEISQKNTQYMIQSFFKRG